ncbi:hypothetical protein K504DRAFT_442302 [Pleomassaria siparia CBS 279.74]|uniref:ABM domain-containing protein n=1 Tax=Pleomassaria siparia CBS 279.74 TaxID=1314801 RepID=A0A6G1JVF5_9PLEO|nr:hypothetical protein K504DRAFT_442302 [Pleomassaria siparia CBS 279.74]
MSEPVAEIVKLTLREGVDISSSTTTTGGGENQDVITEGLKTIRSQPGCMAVWWGSRIETPGIVQMVIEWETLASHAAFEAQPSYPDFRKSISGLLSAAPEIFHIHLSPSAPFSTPGSAPVTECVNMLFPKGYSPAAYTSNWKSFCTEGAELAKEARGAAGAWSIEEVKHEGVWNEEENGEEGPTFVAFIGWTSVEAHTKFRETDDFAKIIPYLRDGPKGVEVCHVAFKKFE